MYIKHGFRRGFGFELEQNDVDNVRHLRCGICDGVCKTVHRVCRGGSRRVRSTEEGRRSTGEIAEVGEPPINGTYQQQGNPAREFSLAFR